jgi:arylsulfatase A-like enzyme
MTGKFPARHGVTDWIGAREGTAWKRNTKLLPAHYQHVMDTADTTLAEAFHEAGYRTFFAGKWHMGSTGSLPKDHGFDINVGGFRVGSPPGGFFSPYNNPKLKNGPPGESLPKRLGAETADFIDEHRDQPFFAYLSFYSVHAPIQSTKQLWKKYRDKAAQQPTPDRRFLIDRTTPVRQVQDHPVYAGMVEAMDDAVGMVLDRLDALGLEENTIVVFTSDNGGVSAGDGKATSNLPLRGGKGRQWEGGIREPYYIKWPGVVSPGSETDVPATGTDFFPTLLEIAGLDPLPEQHVDGVSLVPVLRGGTLPSRPLYWHYPHYGNQGGEPSSILREGNWKLIHYYEDGRNELYHLEQDPGEQNDLAAEQSERTAAMAKRLKEWLDSVGANYPVPNPNYDPEAARKQAERIRNRVLPRLERRAANFLKEDFQPNKTWWGSRVND